MAEQPSPMVSGSPVNNVMEAVGLAAVVAFWWWVWPPLVLLAGGVVLVVVANLRDARRRPKRVAWSERAARALAAYRAPVSAGLNGGR